MLKKIVTYILLALAVLIFCGYFTAASILSERGCAEEFCTGISVRILDSTVNRFVSEEEIKSIISSSAVNPAGKLRSEVRLHDIETLLDNRSAIKKSDVSLSKDGILDIRITQRRPLLRIQTGNGGYYIDDTGYIFPWVSSFTSYVPVVTGHIPVKLKEGYRGVPGDAGKEWVEQVIALAGWLDRHPVWNAQIQQIYVESNGDIVFYNAIGDQKIIFGAIDNIEYKFAKLRAFYKEIVPEYGWERYKEVNLKFSNQIVCTLRDGRQTRNSSRI
ncbi:MAG TPA: cell division protein FtsQ [Candidatus Coprenecus stercoravium]|uniref:Cell division protein FtsQ n=1 Tax=Candidatus Coprenecus stercoravium TaxID=2840735 RepID=A0A9D2GRU4_9BACT|nr:cell division protein FtsQ [Candidatus Coprenecus stercoravium]